MASRLFLFENLNLRYEPFPIGIIKPLMDGDLYRQLVQRFPSLDHFASYQTMEKYGNKYTFSEKEHPKLFRQYIQSDPLWREFYGWIKSDEFVYHVLDTLIDRNVNLGFKRYSPLKRFLKRSKGCFTGSIHPETAKLRARFEFSALPADGGYLPPHTDAPTKIATMIVSILDENEWPAEFGGGTDVNKPVNAARYGYNQLNELADFDDMEVLSSYEFTPNQGILFVKTFNSWHSVRPIKGAGSKQLRKTLTINIERFT
jgi:hypothetical protein